MTSTEPRPRAARRFDELIGIGFAATISVLAIVYTVAPFLPVLIAWEVAAVVYLVLLFTTFRNRTTRNVPSSERALPARVLEYLSWILPV
jgi:Flp pilus assembly protein TadB